MEVGANWLKCEVVAVSETRTKLTFHAEFDEGLKESFRTQPDGIGCDVRVAVKRDVEPVRLNVDVVRRPFASVSPRVVKILDVEDDDFVVVKLEDDGAPLKLTSMRVRPDGFDVKLDSETDHELRFRVHANAAPTSKVHVVTLKLASGDDEIDASFVIQSASE